MITKNKLQEILNDMSKQDEGYMCEAQFQHELAFRLREQLADKNIRVHLEYNIYAGERKRCDIVLEDKQTNRFCLIELKYKTHAGEIKYGGKSCVLKTQGAQNLGRFDYLYDIMRIETYAESHPEKFDGGFAIFLTNDNLYSTRGTKEKSYAEFSINDNIVHGKKVWGNNTSVGEFRKNGLTIIHDYTVEWLPYGESGKFKYLMLEVPPHR